MRRKLDFVRALQSRDLFGGLPCFRDLESWARWRVFAKAVHGLPLTSDELGVFQHHTGRTSPAPGGHPETVCIVGVQSGKSRMAGTLAAYSAMIGEPGTYSILVSQDHRAAMRTLFGYAKEPFEKNEALQDEIVKPTADTLELRSGVFLAAYPCRPAAIRGLRANVVIIDELAFFTATDGRPTDLEMLRAARGRVATTGGKLVIISSPYGQSGALWDLYRKHFGRDDSPVLVWKATAPEMNPTLKADYLDRMQQDDPDAYRSEVLGEFRAGISTLLDENVLIDAVDRDVRERIPSKNHSAFFDAASGTGSDRATLAIAHRDGELSVLDLARAWRPPFSPSAIIAEASDLLKRYGLHEIQGDRYAPGFVSELFRANGIRYLYSDLDRSGIYLEFLHQVNSGRVRLLDQPELLREFRGLERRRGTSGRDRIDHRPGSHDDLANASAGALVRAAKPVLAPLIFVL